MGHPLELIDVQEARDAKGVGEVFCRAYLNFYIANDAVIMPAYGTSSDERIRLQLQRIFPNRSVVPVDVAAIAEGGGGIHCATQQQPA